MSAPALPPPGSVPVPSADTPSPPSDLPPAAPQKPSVLDAAKTIRPLEDLQRLPNMPCARYSLLFGIVAGVSVGSLRFIFSRTARRGTLMGGGGGSGRWAEVGAAANWAVGAWGVGSLGAWETCRARQTAEAARMNALVSEIKARRAAKLAKMESSAAEDRPPNKNGVRVAPLGQEAARSQELRRADGEAQLAESTPSSPSSAASSKSSGGWFGGRI